MTNNHWTKTWKTAVIGVTIALGAAACAGLISRKADTAPTWVSDHGSPATLPRPSGMPVDQFEGRLFEFLNEREYMQLGWRHDKGVRDTGPFIDGTYYGTHPAVRVYYSPEVIQWLESGRQGAIPDGAMIIKEQYAAPAARHDGKTDSQLFDSLESWTVMVKDSAGSRDGWFWSNPVKGQCVVDNTREPYEHPVSGFGHYCVRCHASTHSPGTNAADIGNEYTFAALRNIEGYPGEPIRFRVDDSWRGAEASVAATGEHASCARQKPPKREARPVKVGFEKLFPSIGRLPLEGVKRLPPVTQDWAFSGRDDSKQFVTSNQCMSCHAGLNGPFGPAMFVSEKKYPQYGDPGRDVSPYGEWRWSPMGLAGRDPVFFAQLESELEIIKREFSPEQAVSLGATLTDTCLRCHGAMGQRQFHLDHPNDKFTLTHHLGIASKGEHLGHGDGRYGALARDGISCLVCHRMKGDPKQDLQSYLKNTITGNFDIGDPGEVFGPFKDDEISPYAMEHAIGMKPKHSEFLKSSRLCASCHTVSLPTIDRPLEPGHGEDELIKAEPVAAFRGFHHHLEQSTYLEWVNSEYENEFKPTNPLGKSCQDCHMPSSVDGSPIQTRIAAIQDDTYPDAENMAEPDKLRVRVRKEGYRRHSFTGLNATMVEMFGQFDDVLGVRKTDFMTGSKSGISDSVGDSAKMAREDVADVKVEASWTGPNTLTAKVTVHNKVGHRFPSGVGFRRAFLEFNLVETGEQERVVWSSGRTNEFGVIVGPDGEPLRSEFFTGGAYQSHHELITSPDQVQIYETLLKDATGQFTTSFVHGCDRVKDNRLLPRGWKPEVTGLSERFVKATHPGETASDDARYADGSGSDELSYRVRVPGHVDPNRLEVRVRLHYQSLPPYFLRNLFENAPEGPATQRLHFMSSRLELKGTPLEGWKLPVAEARCGVE